MPRFHNQGQYIHGATQTAKHSHVVGTVSAEFFMKKASQAARMARLPAISGHVGTGQTVSSLLCDSRIE